LNGLLLAALLLPVPAHPQAVSSGAVRIALIENVLPHFTDEDLGAPLLRLLQRHPSSGTLEGNELLPCYYSGSDYRFRIPGGLGDIPEQVPAISLETDAAVAIIFPPAPSLIKGLLEAGQDVAAFPQAWSIHPATRSLTLSATATPSGEALITALLDPAQGEGARWHNTVAGLARLRWEGQDVFAIMVGKGFGGMGRLATALRSERRQGPPIIGVARQDVLGEPLSEFKGTSLTEALARLGLAYAAVGPSEIFGWKELDLYRSSHPAGVRFLSANLVYSSAPAVSFLPDHALVTAGGLRIAITALTPPDAAKYLARAGLGGLSIADPISALKARLPAYRERADLVVLLARSRDITQELRLRARGVDLILAEGGGEPTGPRGARLDIRQSGRRDYEPPLAVLRDSPWALDLAEVSLERRGRRRDLRVRTDSILLDDSVPVSDDFPEFDPETFGITFSTEPPLLPAGRDLLLFRGEGQRSMRGLEIGDREFWTMAAVLLAQEAGAEAGLLRAWPLEVTTGAPVKESLLRVWLRYDDQPVSVLLKGGQLKSLFTESLRWSSADVGGQPAFVVGGMGPAGTTTVHGLPIDPAENYRVATSRTLADILGLPGERELLPGAESVAETVLAALRKRRGGPPGAYGGWMRGRPAQEEGLWRVNFRDLSLNLQNTQVVRAEAFDSVPNPRIQGSNELLIGGSLKTDADYLLRNYRWGNTLELDYARSRLSPRDRPPITNVTANRLSFTTGGTRRAGSVWAHWLARSWGPSLAFNYEGQLEATPPLRRRQIYSLYPGAEFYDGTFVRTLRLAANIKRDYSVDPVHTQYGLRARALFGCAFGPASVKLEGEAWANYFLRTAKDRSRDLLWESDVNLKLRIPIRRHLAVAPFIDFYSFALKTQPLWGYSAMTGVSIGFSRLWKPQYEKF
jgi:hypothetical protein